MNGYQDDIHLLTGAYAVDALDDLERARFEQHLKVCDDCLLEVSGLSQTAALLPETTARAPRPEVRDSVLAAISTVRPAPPIIHHEASQHRVPRRASVRWFPVLAVAAAITLIFGLAWQPWSNDSESGPDVQLTAAERVLGAPDAEKVSLEIEGGGQATVVRSVAEGKAVVVTNDMPDAPTGKDFELWFRDDTGHLDPAGLMPDGPENTIVLRGDASDITGVGITVEPDGGSDVPTSSPIALFEFAGVTT